jgi:hypothetical protein
VELSGFSRLAIKIAGLFMIAISLDHLPSNLVTFMGVGLPDTIRVLLGSMLFIPSLISIGMGTILVFSAEAVVGRAFMDGSGEAAIQPDTTRAFEEAAIFLLGVYIFVVSTSEIGYYLFNYYFAFFESKTAANYTHAQANPIDFGVLFAYAIRFLLAFGLILGANNLSRLHQRIRTYRPMKDVRDV